MNGTSSSANLAKTIQQNSLQMPYKIENNLFSKLDNLQTEVQAPIWPTNKVQEMHTGHQPSSKFIPLNCNDTSTFNKQDHSSIIKKKEAQKISNKNTKREDNL